MFHMRHAVLSVLMTLPLFSVEITSTAQAVNIAGKQRMFTQRMLKDYAMMGMENPFGDPKKDLESIMATFEDHLKALEAFAKDDETKAAIADVRKLWNGVKTMCAQKPELSKAEKMKASCNALLKASDKVVKSLVKASGKSNDAIVDLAGRQRMLSQRMASLYMLRVWGMQDPAFQEELKQAMREFKEAHEKLKASSLNDAAINAKLQKVERSFMFFEMMSRSDSKFIPSLIYRKSDEILNTMNDVTHMYEQKLSK